jgi:hypothetical protein
MGHREKSKTEGQINVPSIRRDANRKVILPQVVCTRIRKTTLLKLGNIKTSPDSFHSINFIYPVGYKVERTGDSMIHPNKETTYTMTILDGGKVPIFQVEAADQPGKIMRSSGTPDIVVRNILKSVRAIRNLPPSYVAAVNGSGHFGLRISKIMKVLQELPGADQLNNYKWKNYVEAAPRADIAPARSHHKRLEHE